MNKTTKSAQFTPGPWSLCNWMVGNNTPTGEVTICGPEGDEHICTMDGNEDNQANGNLIAAAPEMYEALKQALIIVESAYLDDYAKRKQHCTDDEAGMSSDEQASFEALQLVKAAIAKAEGR